MNVASKHTSRTGMRSISKYIFLNSLDCYYRGWALRREGAKPPLSMGERFRMEQGMDVGRRARNLYTGGVLVDETGFGAAVEETKALMADERVPAIFEASFAAGEYAAKADILERTEEGWHLIEVKSGLNEKGRYIDDVAYTALVIDHAGTVLSRASLLLLSAHYRLGMCDRDLFREHDCRAKVFARREDFRPLWPVMMEKTGGEEAPGRQLDLACRGCDMFRDCLGAGIDYHIFDLPHLSRKRFDALRASGIVSVSRIPDEFSLTARQEKVRECVKAGAVIADRGLKEGLSGVRWPCFYLDFETVSTAIPLYPGIAPQAHITTQFSVHECVNPGQVTDHVEYLADPAGDCRRELARRLIECLGHGGSIIVYSRFERDRIRDLMREFPDLSDQLNSLLDRLVDLEAIVRGNVNHPDFHGRTSIKQVLPVLVPEMTYDGLAIGEGGDASAYFAGLATGQFRGREDEIRQALLDYCRQDTLGMVKLHEQLLDCAGQLSG